MFQVDHCHGASAGIEFVNDGGRVYWILVRVAPLDCAFGHWVFSSRPWVLCGLAGSGQHDTHARCAITFLFFFCDELLILTATRRACTASHTQQRGQHQQQPAVPQFSAYCAQTLPANSWIAPI